MWSAGCPSLELERQTRPGPVVAVFSLIVSLSVPWVLPLALPLQILSACGLSVLIVTGCRLGGLIGQPDVTRATWDADGNWWLAGPEGARWQAVLSGGTYLMPSFIWLRWRSDRGSFRWLLWRAAIDPTTNRRLAVRLRLYRATGGGFGHAPDLTAGVGYSSADRGP